MNIRVCATAILLLAAVGGAAWNWNQRQEIARARTLKPDARERATMQKRLDETLAAVQRLRERQTEITTRKERPEAASPSVLTTAEEMPGEVLAERANLAQLEATVAVDRGYAALFAALRRDGNLSDAQFDHLRNLLVKRQHVEPEPEPDGDVSEESWMSAFVAIDEEIRQTLGDAGNATYLRYREKLPQRSAVELVAQMLNYNATPLTDTQAEQLMSVLAQFPAKGEGELAGRASRTVLFSPPDSIGIITDEAVAAAAKILLPDQLQALQQAQQHQQAQRKLFAWLDKLQRPPEPAADKTP